MGLLTASLTPGSVQYRLKGIRWRGTEQVTRHPPLVSVPVHAHIPTHMRRQQTHISHTNAHAHRNSADYSPSSLPSTLRLYPLTRSDGNQEGLTSFPLRDLHSRGLRSWMELEGGVSEKSFKGQGQEENHDHPSRSFCKEEQRAWGKVHAP